MNQYLLLIILSITTSLLFGQQNALTTITSAGGFEKNEEGVSISWTMGEVFSHVENSLIVTEGFQQGELSQQPDVLLTATRLNNQYVRLDLEEVGIINSKVFVLQRSIGNTENFTTIAQFENQEDLRKEIVVDANDSEQITHYRVLYFHQQERQNTNLAQAEGMKKAIRVNTFPNPTTNYIQVKFEGKLDDATTVNILSMDGNIVYSNIYNTLENELITIQQVETFIAGEYILQVIGKDNEVLETIKFIKV